MFKIQSITGRMFIGIIVALLLGVVVIVALPSFFGFPLFSYFGFGTLMLFVMMGFTLGLVGVFDHHPIFGFKMRWWIRGAVAGFIFTLMYILLSYDSINVIMKSNLISWMGFSSPFWVLLDGIFIGLVMGWMETKIAGEGSNLPLS